MYFQLLHLRLPLRLLGSPVFRYVITNHKTELMVHYALYIEQEGLSYVLDKSITMSITLAPSASDFLALQSSGKGMFWNRAEQIVGYRRRSTCLAV